MCCSLMKIQNPLSGPKPLMISSLVSPDFVSELLGQDTRRWRPRGINARASPHVQSLWRSTKTCRSGEVKRQHPLPYAFTKGQSGPKKPERGSKGDGNAANSPTTAETGCIALLAYEVR